MITMGHYVGRELELFKGASNWKRYVADLLDLYVGSEVLEVGAGLGGMTRVLCSGRQRRWACLEPDPRMAAEIATLILRGYLPTCCEARLGVVADLPAADSFDTVIYVDVLEHIERPDDELRRALEHLRPGGMLVVVAPAHQWLFSPFDKAIGHYRRHTRSSLLAAAPAVLRPVAVKYLDSVGLLASVANRMLLRRALPSRRQILVWDRILVPASRRVDGWLRFRVGKSIMAVWRRARGSSHVASVGVAAL